MSDPLPTSEPCARCGKHPVLCVCDRIQPHPTRLEVVLLQHPQEMDALLGTASIVTAMFPKAKVLPGLSWANLAEALNRDLDPSRWAILYPASLPKELTLEQYKQPVVLLDRSGDEMPALKGKRTTLDGIVVLDGTWSQGKTLWWRNPWVLKHPRVVLHPQEPSVYGKLRKQPRREGLSTLEATAEALAGLGEDAEIVAHARSVMRTLCQRARDAFAKGTLSDGSSEAGTDATAGAAASKNAKPGASKNAKPGGRRKPQARPRGGGVLE